MITKFLSKLSSMFSEQKAELGLCIDKKVEGKIKEVENYIDSNFEEKLVCTKEELKSGLQTVCISDYILNWLKNAEKHKMSQAATMEKMAEFKDHFEAQGKGCGWKFSQALIGEYVEMYQSQNNLYAKEKIMAFMGAWMLRLCFGNAYVIDLKKSGQLANVMLH